MKSPSSEARYMGALVGVATGDILGAAHEGLDLSVYPTDEMLQTARDPQQLAFIRSIHDQHHGMVREVLTPPGAWGRGEQTDDTVQTILVVDSINETGRFDMEDITRRLLGWYNHGHGKGVAGTTALSLMLAEAGVVWQQAGQQAIDLGTVWYQWPHQTEPQEVRAVPSNGSVMRTTPIGLYFSGSPTDIDAAARDLSILTHAFQECVAVCRFAAQVVGRLAEGWNKTEAVDYATLRSPDTYTRAIDTISRSFAYSGGAYTSLGIALESLMGNDTFEDTLIGAVNPQSWCQIKSWGEGSAGPDTDTYGAIVGGMAGALYGIADIPERWTVSMYPVSVIELQRKAQRLYQRSLARSVAPS